MLFVASKQGSAFVIFPVQTITTVDSRVVQLGYLDGHLVISSLSRCYLCDTERCVCVGRKYGTTQFVVSEYICTI